MCMIKVREANGVGKNSTMSQSVKTSTSVFVSAVGRLKSPKAPTHPYQGSRKTPLEYRRYMQYIPHWKISTRISSKIMLLKTTKKLLLIDFHVYPLKSRQNVSHVSAEAYRWTGRTSLTTWSHKMKAHAIPVQHTIQWKAALSAFFSFFSI